MSGWEPGIDTYSWKQYWPVRTDKTELLCDGRHPQVETSMLIRTAKLTRASVTAIDLMWLPKLLEMNDNGKLE